MQTSHDHDDPVNKTAEALRVAGEQEHQIANLIVKWLVGEVVHSYWHPITQHDVGKADYLIHVARRFVEQKKAEPDFLNRLDAEVLKPHSLSFNDGAVHYFLGVLTDWGRHGAGDPGSAMPPE